jgi:hypothetical protein
VGLLVFCWWGTVGVLLVGTDRISVSGTVGVLLRGTDKISVSVSLDVDC